MGEARYATEDTEQQGQKTNENRSDNWGPRALTDYRCGGFATFLLDGALGTRLQ
jgi:hypothetical protein